MPSDDERREAADKLRDFETLREVFKESSICAFLDVFNDGCMDWEHICARLADLIEPEERTCRAECFPPGHERGLHQVVCSECGALVFGPVMPGDERGSMFRFCPNCGAKVVEE